MCCIFDGYQFSMKDTSNTSCSSIYLSTEIAWPSNENGSLFMTLFKSCNGQKHRLPMHAGLAGLRNVIYSSSKEGKDLGDCDITSVKKTSNRQTLWRVVRIPLCCSLSFVLQTDFLFCSFATRKITGKSFLIYA